MDKVSVVIPTYNAADSIKACLEAIHELSKNKSLEIEVIVIDAGSTDGTVEIAQSFDVKTMIFPGISRGAARNEGAKIAQNGVITFLDSDCIITSEWIEQLCKTDKNLGSNIITGPAVLVEGKGIKAKAIRNLLSDQVFTLSSMTFSRDNTQQEVIDVPGSNLIVSKTFFEHIGGFPNLNFNEDNVFCSKVRNHGGRILFFPSFRVIHLRMFKSIKKFGSYFYQYGRSYGSNLKLYPEVINRYVLVVGILIPCLLGFSAVCFSAFGDPFLLFLLILISSIFVVAFCYSILRYKNISNGIIPLLFTILLFSFLWGFYYGSLQSLARLRQNKKNCKEI